MSNIIETNQFLIERTDGKSPMTLNLSETNIAMSRINEIKNVNTATFPELLTVFISANSELSNAISSVKLELVRSEHKLGLLRSRLLIEEVPVMLVERNLKGTVDTNNSLILMNETYSGLLFSYEVLKASLDILEGKAKTLRDAQFAIKSVAELSFRGSFNKKMTIDQSGDRFQGEF